MILELTCDEDERLVVSEYLGFEVHLRWSEMTVQRNFVRLAIAAIQFPLAIPNEESRILWRTCVIISQTSWANVYITHSHLIAFSGEPPI